MTLTPFLLEMCGGGALGAPSVTLCTDWSDTAGAALCIGKFTTAARARPGAEPVRFRCSRRVRGSGYNSPLSSLHAAERMNRPPTMRPTCFRLPSQRSPPPIGRARVPIGKRPWQPDHNPAVGSQHVDCAARTLARGCRPRVPRRGVLREVPNARSLNDGPRGTRRA
jgi:hypothetical protein